MRDAAVPPPTSSRSTSLMRVNTRSTAPSAASARVRRGPLIHVAVADSPTSPIAPCRPAPSLRNCVRPSTTFSRSSTDTPYSPAIVARRLALDAFQPPLTTSTASATRSKSVRSSAVSPSPGLLMAVGATTGRRATGASALPCAPPTETAPPAAMRAAARLAAFGCSGPRPVSAISAWRRSAASSSLATSRVASALFPSGCRAITSSRCSSAAST